jgi:hypothetical protein
MNTNLTSAANSPGRNLTECWRQNTIHGIDGRRDKQIKAKKMKINQKKINQKKIKMK